MENIIMVILATLVVLVVKRRRRGSEATRGGKQIPRVYINCQGREFACSHLGARESEGHQYLPLMQWSI